MKARKAIVIWTGAGYVGHKGGAHMQLNAKHNCIQCFGDDPVKIGDEVGLFEGEYMQWVEIKFGKRIKLKGTQNEETN